MRFSAPRRLAQVLTEPDDGDSTEGPELYLMPLPDGPAVRLGGTAALIWLVASEGSEDVISDVAEIAGRQREDVESDVNGYLDFLVGQTLLEQTDP